MESQLINTYFNDQVQDIFDQNQSDLFERKYDNFLNKMIEIFDKPDEEQEQDILDQNQSDLFERKYDNFLNKMIEIFDKPEPTLEEQEQDLFKDKYNNPLLKKWSKTNLK